MSEAPLYKCIVHVRNPEALSQDTIIRSPRVFKPHDLIAACQNLDISAVDCQVKPVADIIRFVLTDFFILAHRTGLYNRQRALWESLTKVSMVSVFQRKAGILRPKPIPVYDLHFEDHRARTLVFAFFNDGSAAESDKAHAKAIKDVLQRGEKIPGLAGIFYCCRAPFPNVVRDLVLRLTKGNDPVGHWESILPKPLSVSINLLEVKSDISASDETATSDLIRLVHPDLTNIKRIRVASTSN